MIATNHLHVLEQNPLKLSFTSRELKVPQYAQATSSGGELEEPPPGNRRCLVRSGASSHLYNSAKMSPDLFFRAKGKPVGPFGKMPVSSGLCEYPIQTNGEVRR